MARAPWGHCGDVPRTVAAEHFDSSRWLPWRREERIAPNVVCYGTAIQALRKEGWENRKRGTEGNHLGFRVDMDDMVSSLNEDDFLYEYAICTDDECLVLANGVIHLLYIYIYIHTCMYIYVCDITPTSSQAKLPRLYIGNAMAAEALLQEMRDRRTG